MEASINASNSKYAVCESLFEDFEEHLRKNGGMGNVEYIIR